MAIQFILASQCINQTKLDLTSKIPVVLLHFMSFSITLCCGHYEFLKYFISDNLKLQVWLSKKLVEVVLCNIVSKYTGTAQTNEDANYKIKFIIVGRAAQYSVVTGHCNSCIFEEYKIVFNSKKATLI
jgi:hypothetical protein